jgi:hypothetical protein
VLVVGLTNLLDLGCGYLLHPMATCWNPSSLYEIGYICVNFSLLVHSGYSL